MRFRELPIVAAAALLCACTAWSHVDRQGAAGPQPSAGPGRVAVALALSGGGVRAAALSWGVMQELGRLVVPAEDGSPSTLLREVDYVSSVSGGSFAAAYWALHRDDAPRLGRFADTFLYPNHERRLAWRAFGNPLNWLRLPFTAFDRTDVAARYYGRTLFDDRSYAALPARPRLIVNASDLVTGSRFEFTDEFFGCLGARLADYPLGYAVAASSAYPVGFAAVTLRNFGAPAGGCLTTSDRAALLSAQLNPEAWLRATRKQRFLETERVPYVHLVDGGITDNLGLQGLLERLTDGELSDLLNTRKLAGVVVIVVNAMPAHDVALGRRAETPGVLEIADQSFGLMLEQASTRTSRAVRAAIDERRAFEESLGRTTQLHYLEIRLSDLESAARRERLLAAPTRLALPRETVDDLLSAGRDLLYCGGGQRRNAATLAAIVGLLASVAGRPAPAAIPPPAVAC
ncbi:MAG TPA: patatin-like phospholipase family protein [Methylomirabilota bacterium]|nr:patatin-like phospholipase family protein [Methylomirabilota bacterium]